MSGIGWRQLQDDVELLSLVEHSCRLENYKLEVTVPSEKKLRELAWAFVEAGARVNLHTRTSITILSGKDDERVIWAMVRS